MDTKTISMKEQLETDSKVEQMLKEMGLETYREPKESFWKSIRKWWKKMIE